MVSEIHDEEAIFKVACQIESPQARATYLAQVCGDDRALFDRVALLLRAQEEQPSFLESPPAAFGATLISPEAAEAPGTMIGPYKLLEQIGEGGFGIVYMADQQAPVRRRVALKIIKPGMDTKQVLARFEAELQALSLMDHPNIARALDAGATDSGRPYFVMELVRGVSITEYCDQNNLAVDERLDLFVTVCHAVQHAHQKGIIHRDIKPSNVLVTMHDGRPVPKVIDFGVAKAINQQLTQETIFTRFAEMIGTPLYMSPEQAEMTSLDIDTRSDIYSLGVLLYELLTGTTPFSRDRLRKAGHDEICRIIREEEPAKPSTRISTLGVTGAAVAAHRHSSPNLLGRLMCGDLDWIVMKALEKDRTRRYETANGLAMDLQRHLAEEPVMAGPPSAAYRFRKFARRNRAALAMIAVVTVALLLGIVGTTWQAIRATWQRDRAVAAEGLAQTRLESESHARAAEAEQRREAETQREQAEANFKKARAAVDEYFTLVSESKLLDVPGLQPLRKELLEAALRYYEAFLNQRSSDPKVRTELAATWLRVAQVYHQNNRTDDAVRTLNQGLEIVESLVREKPGVAEFPVQLAGLRKGGRILQFFDLWPSDAPEAICVYQKAAALWEQFARENPTVVGFQSDLASFYRYSGDMQVYTQQPAEALRSFQNACQIWDKLVRENPNQPEFRAGLAESLEYVGSVLRNTTRRQESEAAFRRALALRERLVADFPGVPDYRAGLANSFRRLGTALHAFGRMREAEDAHRQALALWEKLTTEFPGFPGYRKQLANTHDKLHLLFQATGQPQEAEKALRQALEIQLKLSAETPGERGDNLSEARDTLVHLANLLKDTGRPQETQKANLELEKAFRQLLAISEQLVADLPDDAHIREQLGHTYRRSGGWRRSTGGLQEAEQAYRDAQAIWSKLAADFPKNLDYQLQLSFCHNDLANLLKSAGRPAEAEQRYRQALSLKEKLVADSPANPDYRFHLAHTQLGLANLFGDTKRPEVAERHYRQAVELFEKAAAHSLAKDYYRADLGHTLWQLGDFCLQTGKLDEAEKSHRRATAVFEKLAADFPANAYFQVEQGFSNWKLGGLLAKDIGRLHDAAESYRKALAIYAKLSADFPNDAEYRSRLARSYVLLIEVLLPQNKHAESAKLAVALPRVQPDKWDDHERAAGDLEKCAALAQKDESLPPPERKSVADGYAKQAEELRKEVRQRINPNPLNPRPVSADAHGTKPKETPTKPRETPSP